MVFGNENYEGKLKYSLEQHGLVSQFSRWIVDRIVKRRCASSCLASTTPARRPYSID